ncbi:helix-turn-helix domain-containing protein [Enorma phocaeensis]|uniref:helix-turn-helix domain-containing protein n=1 Tax=Enorma phocaeensis TaxID=1871019 RepID=UPI000C860A49|nr:helix-turn-helix domain-containing protein [Enorma phocaeensis]
MGRYKHLTIGEREDIMRMRREGRRVGEMAREIGRDESTVSRELRRNSRERFYRASTAQRRYEARRERCRRPRLLDDPERLELVRSRVLEGRWSPEQLEGRILLERPDLAVSDATIYREVAAGRLDRCIGGPRASARLRRRGRRRRQRGEAELRWKSKSNICFQEVPLTSKQIRTLRQRAALYEKPYFARGVSW